MLNLQHPEVRALHWCVFGPNLLELPKASGLRVEATPERLSWLESLDSNPAPLLNFMADKCNSPRLGLQFESYWHFFLEQDHDFQLLGHNIPVRDNGRTLGEFDVICYQRSSGIHFHLELAVKFYLQAPPVETDSGGLKPLSQWLGPNCRDRLDLKIDRLSQHQLPLSQYGPGKALLRDLNIENTEPAAIIKGCVFYRDSNQLIDDEYLAAEHQRGVWRSNTDWSEDWRMLEKPDWFKAEEPKPIPPSIQRPIMLINNQGEGESERGFATPKTWPLSAAKI